MKSLFLASIAFTSLAAGAALSTAPASAAGADLDGDGRVTVREGRATALTVFAALDTNADGAVSAADAATGQDRRRNRAGRGRGEGGPLTEEGFARLDADDDEALSFEEFSADALTRFDRTDADGDGVIGTDEMPERLRNAANRADRSMPERAEIVSRLQERFDALDTDGSASLSLEEAKAGREMMKDRRGRSGDRGALRFARLDQDADGRVTKNEFLAVAEAEFERLDADGDGVLIVAELGAPRPRD